MTQSKTGSRRKIAAFVAATLVLATAAACGDLTGVPASLPTLSDSGIVYALNGAPPGAPTALHMFSGTLLAADGSFIFDVAFDIDSAGNVVVLPEPAVASGLVTNHTVSLATVPDAYDALGSAPKITYRADTALVTKPNVTIVAQSSDPNACGVSLTGTTLYAKIVVTSVDLVNRQLKVRFTSDPNCGFRSFSSGIPKD
ncbi:MAG TPA: hypothetical protein VGM50_14915 [Gemmatimonadaceae bacterium]